MNKYEEALATMHWSDSEIRAKGNAVKWQDARDLLQELVERATPMKGKVTSLGCHCSKCDYVVGNNNGWTQGTVKFCSNCGQAIDWSNE